MDGDIQMFDGMTPELRRIAGRLRNTRPMMAAIGKQLEKDLRDHFRQRDSEPNAMGWPKRHFWRDEGSKNTALAEVTEHSARVVISSPAIAHKVQPINPVTPKRGRMLAIPMSAEAYKAGRAKLFPRELHLIARKGAMGRAFLAETKGKGKASRLVVHYMLLASTSHKPDPRALPVQAALAQSILARARRLADRHLASA